MAEGLPIVCASDLCTDNQLLTTEGTCEECPEGEVLLNKYECGIITCTPTENQILLEDGTCKDCPPGLRPNEFKMTCEDASGCGTDLV